MNKLTNDLSKIKITKKSSAKVVNLSSESEESISEQQSISETSSIEKLFKHPETKKVKISPFAGGLSNNIKKKEDDSLDTTQIFKNKQNMETILKYLNGYKVGAANPIKGIIIRGNIGCGKLTMLKACIKKAEYTSLMYDADSEIEDMFDNLLLTIEAKGFYKLMQQKGKSKRVIVIRDIEGTLKPTEKTNFFKFIGKSNNTIPILMTSTDRSVGSTREVPKYILQLDFEDPSVAELVRHFSSDKISKSALEKIIIISKFDLRYIYNIINGLEHSKTKMNIKKVDNFAKDIELDTFSCIRFCADSTKSWEQKLIHASLYTNSTVFHNYPTILKQITGEQDDMELCSKIADTCCDSEIFINYSFENQAWDILDECYNTLGTIGPLEMMTKHELEFNNLTYPSSNLTVNKDDDVEFAILEKESMVLPIILSRYFNGNKFIGDQDAFNKEIKSFKYPVQAYKLANIMTDQKKVNAFLREFKKKIIKEDDI
jgi:hypothetical protein